MFFSVLFDFFAIKGYHMNMRIEYIIIIAAVCVVFGLCLCLAIASFGYDKFYEKLVELSKKSVQCNLTALEYVALINDRYFSSKLQIVAITGKVGDAYGKGKVYLSQNTIASNSIASFAIISHELGHAFQDKEGKKLKRLYVFRRIIRALGIFFWPLLLAGVILLLIGGDLGVWGIILSSVAATSIVLALMLKIMTISIEKDASKRAVKLMQEFLTEIELKQAKKLLSDAKLTYWADFFRAVFGWTMLTKKGDLFH